MTSLKRENAPGSTTDKTVATGSGPALIITTSPMSGDSGAGEAGFPGLKRLKSPLAAAQVGSNQSEGGAGAGAAVGTNSKPVNAVNTAEGQGKAGNLKSGAAPTTSTTATTTTSPTTSKGQAQYRIGNYLVERSLGEGNFAKVKLGCHVTTGDKVAIKIIDKSKVGAEAIQKLSREVKVLKLLNHPHIIRLYEVINTPRELILIMEYARGGEMHGHLTSNGRMREVDARRFFRQIASALEQCHRLRVIHRDLKTENLLLDENMNVKLVDFGFGNLYDPRQRLNTHCGSPPFASPELFLGKDYIGPEIDMWSTGVLLYVFLTGSLPFGSGNFNDTRSRVLEGKFRIPFYLSSEAADLLRGLLNSDPVKRLNVGQMKRHPWMNVGIEEVVPSVDSNTVLKLTPAEEEQVYEEIKKMENISVDQVKKSVSTNAYDEFAAYYYLISDKLFHKREAMAKEHLHEDKVPITPKVAPNEIPIDDVRERILHTERYYHTGLFAGLRGKKKQKTNGSGNKVHPIGGTVAVVTPTSGKDKDKDAPATPSPTTLSPDRQGQNAATLPRKHSVSPMSLRRSLDDRLPPLAVYLLASVTTVVSPREIIKRLVITLTRDLGMSPVLPAVLEQRSAIDVLISGLSLDKALLRLPEGAKYFFGATPDLPWTVRVIEKSEVTGEIGQELDVEVCRVLRFRKTFGVKFRRRGGDAWRFQELCRTIARKMNLG